MTIKLGDTVRQIQPAPVTGTVVAKTFDQAGDRFQYLVETSTVEGESHQLAFDEGQIEAIATPGAQA
jgi:hypothetical protein